MDRLKESFKEISGGRVLDVGTGRGSFIAMLQECLKDYSEIIGIDTEDKTLQKASENFKQENIKFLKMDASKMDFEDNCMDIVSISNSLHHLPNMINVLDEMKRVLKPGGLFIINEMFCDNQSNKQLSHVYLHHLAGEIDTLCGVCHNKTFKKQEIFDIVSDLGLDIIDKFEYNTHEGQKSEISTEEEEQHLNAWLEGLDKIVERIKDLPQYEEYKKRINDYKYKLHDVGMLGATELIIIGKK